MRNLLAVIIVLLAVSFTNVASEEKGLARVQKVVGKEVYILSEPLREYEVVETVTTTNSLLGIQANIQKQMEETLTAWNKKAEKGKVKPFDAAVTTDGDKILLIKFKD